MNINCTIPSIDQQPGWQKATGPDINPKSADGQIVQLPSGLRLYCSGEAYAGWLAKFVSPFFYPFTKVSLSFKLVIDPATLQQAQVEEFDSKITDADGWTYDFSAQLVIPEGWAFQVVDEAGNWIETGVKANPPVLGVEYAVRIDYVLDFNKHTSSVVHLSAGGVDYPISTPAIEAKQLGWQKSSILTQIQQCNNYLTGAHAEEFRQVSYFMSV